VVFLSDWDSALWQSWAKYHSCTVHSHTTKNYISCQKIHCTCYTSGYQPILANCWSLFTQNNSLTETLGQATSRSWWTIDTFCSTFLSLPYSSSFLLHWPSPTPFQPPALTYASAKPIREHLPQHTHPAALRVPDSWCHYFTQYQCHHLPQNCLCCQLEYRSRHSSSANHWHPKWFQMHCLNDFLPDDSSFFWFGGYWIFEFVLQGGPLQTMLVVKEIFLTNSQQPQHHVEIVSTMLWPSLPCLSCILRLSSTCVEHVILSV